MPRTPLYQNLAETIRAQIAAGVFRPGERLPSIRRLRNEHRVSLNTVKSALQLLEDWRLVDVRPQSGHFVAEGAGASPKEDTSQTGQACVVQTNIPVRMNSALSVGPQATLGAAVQSPELMPLKALTRLFQQVMREEPELCHSYDAPPGSLRLRRAIAKRGPEAGMVISADDVVITSGAKEAVYLAIKCVAPPGSIVAIESPAYYALLEVLESLKLKAVEVATDPVRGMQLDHLDHVLGKYQVAAVAMVSNFSNPTGSLMPDSAKRELVGLLGRYDVPLVEDDVYGDLSFHGPRPRAIKSFDTEGRVLYCGSFSKTLSPGLRLGWSVPGRYHQQLQLMKLVINQATAVAPQLVAAEFLESGAYDRHLRQLRRRFQEQMEDATRAIRTCFPPSVRISSPQGGHVLWLELPKHHDAMRLYHQAAELGIQFAPGPIFSPTGGFRNFLRINTGFPWSPHLQRQVRQLGEMLAGP